MNKRIQIENITDLKGPVYVLIAGGIGAGKTHVIAKMNLPIQNMDIDNTMHELGLVEYNRENLAIAIKKISAEFDEKMAKKESLIAMGTSADLTFSINRLYWAKQKGYTTVLLHIDAPADQCLAQNAKRRVEGKRAVSKDEEFKIQRTCQASAATVAALRDTDLVDYFVYYDNTRPRSEYEEFIDL